MDSASCIAEDAAARVRGRVRQDHRLEVALVPARRPMAGEVAQAHVLHPNLRGHAVAEDVHAHELALVPRLQAVVLEDSSLAEGLAVALRRRFQAQHHEVVRRVHEPDRGAAALLPERDLDFPEGLGHRDPVGQHEAGLGVDDDSRPAAAYVVVLHVLAVQHDVQVEILHGAEGHRAHALLQGGARVDLVAPAGLLPGRTGSLRLRHLRRRRRRASARLVRLRGGLGGGLQAPRRPGARRPVQGPGPQRVPVASHLPGALAPLALLGALRDHRRDVEALPVRNPLHGVLKGAEGRHGTPVHLQDHGVRLDGLPEDEAGLGHVDSLERDVVFHGRLVGHLVEDAEPKLDEGVRDEAVEVLDLELQLDALPPAAQGHPHRPAHQRVERDVQEDKVGAGPAVDLEEHVARLQRRGRGGAGDAAAHLQHPAGGRSL
mmetsp:Transcript_53793/g.141868  ORF Transcript_53793/g.141868 Transcript_53793/m.141868 type:complete len:432 (-) Transcript_53793:732-2027(-)